MLDPAEYMLNKMNNILYSAGEYAREYKLTTNNNPSKPESIICSSLDLMSICSNQ